MSPNALSLLIVQAWCESTYMNLRSFGGAGQVLVMHDPIHGIPLVEFQVAYG